MLSRIEHRVLHQFDDILRIVLVSQCHYGRIVNIVSTQLESREEWCVSIFEVTEERIVCTATYVNVEIEGDDIWFVYWSINSECCNTVVCTSAEEIETIVTFIGSDVAVVHVFTFVALTAINE